MKNSTTTGKADFDDTMESASATENLAGLTGNDTYTIGSPNNLVIENAKSGEKDVIKLKNYNVGTTKAYALSSNVEELDLTDINLPGTLDQTKLDSLDGNKYIINGNSLKNTITASADSARYLKIMAGAGDDTVNGSANADNIDGGIGADTILGNGGADTLFGGVDATQDTLHGGSDNDTYVIRDTKDIIVDDGGSNTIKLDKSFTEKGLNSTTTYSSQSITKIDAADVRKNLTLTANNNTDTTIISGSGSDVINGANGYDSLYGGAGNDTIYGGAGENTLEGGVGNDTYLIDGNESNTSIIETGLKSAGIDTIKLVADSSGKYEGGAVTIDDLSTNANTIENIDASTLTNAANGVTLTGNNLANTIKGGAGDDTIDGGSGNNILMGGKGNDTYVVNSYTDKVIEYATSKKADYGIDTVKLSDSYAYGNSRAYNLAANVENLNLKNVKFNATQMAAFAQNKFSANGNALNNIIYASNDYSQYMKILAGAGNDTVFGGRGNDTIDGGAGNDTIFGGNGNNSLAGGAGNDLLMGGSGDDYIDGGAGNDTIFGGNGINTLAGGAGNDVYEFDGTETGSTTIIDKSGVDVIKLLGDNDGSFQGDASSYLAEYSYMKNLDASAISTDLTLNGNNLDNIITGGSGNDTIDGGLGKNTLLGGAGNDTYLVDGTEKGTSITDSSGNDTVKLQADEDGKLAGSLISAYSLEKLNGVEGLDASDITATDLTLTGNALDNTLTGGAGKNTLVGGAGNDTYMLSADQIPTTTIKEASGTSDTIKLIADDGSGAFGDVTDFSLVGYTTIENLDASSITGTDLNLTGNNSSNIIKGGAGDDNISGGIGNDTLFGGTGTNNLDGGADNDTYLIDGNETGTTITDVSGNDTIKLVGDSSGNFSDDSVSMDDFTAVDTKIENLNASSITSDLALTGNGENNVISGGAGSDYIDGGAGDDTINGGNFYIAPAVSTKSQYGSDGKLMSKTDFTYDSHGNKLSSDTLSYMNGYVSGRQIDTYYANGAKSSSAVGQFDSSGHMTSLSKTSFDANGKKSAVENTNYYSFPSIHDVTTVSFDSSGKMTQQTSTILDFSTQKPTSEISYTYSDSGHTNGTKSYTNGVVTGTDFQIFDSNGNQLSGDTKTYETNGTTLISESTYAAAYSSEKKTYEHSITTVSGGYVPTESTYHATFDSNGNKTHEDTTVKAYDVVTSQDIYNASYNSIGTLLSENHTSISSGITTEHDESTFDSNGNKLTYTYETKDGSGNTALYTVGSSVIIDGGRTYTETQYGADKSTAISSEKYVYENDPNGNPTSIDYTKYAADGTTVTDHSSTTDAYTYEAGRIMADTQTKTDKDGNINKTKYTYTYDSNGKILTYGNTMCFADGTPSSSTLTNYDSNGNKLAVTQSSYSYGSTTPDSSSVTAYYLDGTPLSNEYTSFSAGKETYHSISVNYANGKNKSYESESYSYDSGTKKLVSYYNNQYYENGQQSSSQNTQYDSSGNKTYYEAYTNATNGIQTSHETTYYGSNGNITSYTHSSFTPDGNQLSYENYTYDANGKIWSGQQTFDTLDAKGNQLKNEEIQYSNGAVTYHYINLHTYDVAGNVISSENTAYYNGIMNSHDITTQDANGNVLTFEYKSYDKNGNVDYRQVGSSTFDENGTQVTYTKTSYDANNKLDGDPVVYTYTNGYISLLSNDTLFGGTGKNTLNGGYGNDTYLIDGYETSTKITDVSGNDTVKLIADADDKFAGKDNASVSIENYADVEGLDASAIKATDMTLTGNALNNTIKGGDGTNILKGGTGDDTYIIGGDSNTIVEATGAGNDTIKLTAVNGLYAGNDTISLNTFAAANTVENLDASAVTDASEKLTLNGNDLDNTIKGGAGDDIISGGAGKNTLMGGTGSDTYLVDGSDTSTSITDIGANYSEDVDTVKLVLDKDGKYNNAGFTIKEDSGIENINASEMVKGVTLSGNSFDNTITGGAGDDVIFGGVGNSNTIWGNSRTDYLIGGAGNDTYLMDGTEYTTVITELAGVDGGTDTIKLVETNGLYLGNTVIDLTNPNYANVENVNASDILNTHIAIIGNDGDNVLTGNSQSGNSISAGGGNDTITTGDADDLITTGNGHDIVDAGNGNNNITLDASGTGTITGGTGADSITNNGGTYVINAGGGDNMIQGIGNNTVTTGDGNDGIHFGGDGNQIINAGNGNNNITYGNGDSSVITGSGDDQIHVGSGKNTIDAGDGDNVVTTSGGECSLTTGKGDDQIFLMGAKNTVSAGEGYNKINVGSGDNTITAGNGGNYITDGSGTATSTITTGSGDDEMHLSDGNKTVDAGAGNNYITINGTGTNTITALGGNNSIFGGSGADTVRTGSGNDYIKGGAGNDTLTGGSGTDNYVFDQGNGKDLITATNAADSIIIGDAIDVPKTDLLFYTDTNDNFCIDYTAGGINSDIITIAKGYNENTTILLRINNETDPSLNLNLNLNISDIVAELGVLGGYTHVDPSTLLAGQKATQSSAITWTNSTGDTTYNITGSETNKISERVSADKDTLKIVGDGSGTFTATSPLFATSNSIDIENLSKIANTIENVDASAITNGLKIYGNKLDNTLTGGAGSDYIDGGYVDFKAGDTVGGFTGHDVLVGGAGNDTYITRISDSDYGKYDNGLTITETTDGGNDTIKMLDDKNGNFNYSSDGSVSLLNYINVENLDASLISSANMTLTGDGGNNTIKGGAGDDTIDGGAGVNILQGGAGDDTYIFDGTGTDTITDAGGNNTILLVGDGDGKINGNVDYSLSLADYTGIQNIDGFNTDSNLTLTGNDSSNTITSGYGNNILNGGAGDDTYVINNMGTNTITDTSGNDTVKISGMSEPFSNNTISLDALSTTANTLENIDVSEVSFGFTLKGNDSNNTFTIGNTADTDTIIGGKGNDTFDCINQDQRSTFELDFNEGDGKDLIKADNDDIHIIIDNTTGITKEDMLFYTDKSGNFFMDYTDNGVGKDVVEIAATEYDSDTTIRIGDSFIFVNKILSTMSANTTGLDSAAIASLNTTTEAAQATLLATNGWRNGGGA